MKKISIGSKNPIKIMAVENVIKKIWPDADVVAIDAPSSVREQPISDDEAIEGARNRAKLSLQKTGADLGIGLEGGVIDTKHGMFTSTWAVAVDKNGEVGLGCGGRLLLPEKIAAEVRNGKELGPVADEIFGGHNIKQKQGVVGVLTNNLISRTASTEKAVTLALTKFINPENYR